MRQKNDERKMDVYRYVTDYKMEHGVCPTTQEIGDALGMAKSTVSKYMNRLMDDGLIEKHGRYQTVLTDSAILPSDYVLMPVVGSIACGQPILAIEEVEEYIPINVGLLGYGEYFGLIARGDSMIDAGICDGDTVYVRKQSTAIDGEIVVAMVEDEFSDGWSATLKRFYRDMKNNRYILHPENSSLDDIIVEKVHVVGVAVRVLKNLENTKRRFC
ncbi:MAG: repressor LexA [Clostridia bacterium]|nr:repressor LexA [Clostridia bacterium]